MIKLRTTGSHGIRLPDLDIGLDIRKSTSKHIFITHAHSDHVPGKRDIGVITTEPTTRLMRARGFSGETRIMNFHEPLDLPNARVTLYPAGHILGSAMVYVESDEGTLLYTGDCRTPASPACEGFELPNQVDCLITEATFGLPIYKWDFHEILFEEIRKFAQNALADGYTPVLLGYSLGKSQEIMQALAPLKHRIQVHGSAYPLCQIYQEFGFDLGPFERYNRDTVSGSILVTPSSAMGNGMIDSISKARIAYVSGWAALESRRVQMTIDKLIPLSDHLDFFELMNMCEQLQPMHVYVTHSPNPEIPCYCLQKRGISASALSA
ncbi:MAG TPA: hypothetical protein VKA08_00120 [Balneolales bacterium]|nr:hypothetical protein [Balneolales bacterium]